VLEGIGLRGRWVRGLKLEREPVSLKEETELVRFQVARIQIVGLKHYRRLFIGTF